MASLLFVVFGCATPATGSESFGAAADSGFGLDAGDDLSPSQPSISNRPHYVPGEGWKVLVPYSGGDYVDPETGKIWIRTPHGASQPSTGGFIPDRP